MFEDWKLLKFLVCFGIHQNTRNSRTLQFIHKGIAKWNVWLISRWSNADVSNFRCRVWDLPFFGIKHSIKIENFVQIQFFFSFCKGTRDDKICGPAKLKCCMKADSKVFQSENFTMCNCLPSCSTLSYDVTVTQADYDLVESYSLSKYPDEVAYEK